MKRLQILIFILSISSFVTYAGVRKIDAQSELDEITRRLVSTYLEVELNNESVTYYANAIRSDGSFPDLDYVTVHEGAYFPSGAHLKRLDSMAIAYRQPKNKYYASKKILNKIITGLDYWYRVRPMSKNWWFNDIGAQQDFMIPLILLKGEVSDKKLQKYSSYLRDQTGNKAHRGKNRTWVSNITIHKGCLENNFELVRIGFESIVSTIKVEPRQGDDGIKIDGSFHQHRRQLYSGGYGLSYADDIAYYIQLVKGTAFESYFNQKRRDIFSNLLLNGLRWFGYRDAFDFGAVGRNISRPDGVSNVSPITLARMGENEPVYANDYAAWKKHLVGGAFPIHGNKYFWKSDIMVQHGANYYLSAKIISNRTNGTEMLNNENLKGYNLPLGATNIMTTGKEYKNIYPVWNWNRIPGTTAIQNPDSVQLNGYLFGKNDFGGGASNGKNGVMAYEHNYKGVKASKAYFFLENILLCLGAGITSDSQDEVATTINQCYLNGDVVTDKGNLSAVYKKNELIKNPKWVYHDKVGYLFLSKGEFTAESKRQTGSWKNINISESGKSINANIFNLWINHGEKATNGEYGYMVVPDRTLAQFQTFIKTQTFHIIRNTKDVQAVKQKNLFAAVFHRPGIINLEKGLTLSTDKPIIVYIERNGSKFKLWAADPLFNQKQAYLSINGREVRIDFPYGELTGSQTFVEFADFQPFDLQCEYLVNPLGIDIPSPRLSWKMGHTFDIRGKKQTAYQVLVASSQALLDKNQGDLWNSGTVHQSKSVNIAYTGIPLSSGQKCFWKIRFADEQSIWSDWSTTAFWRMGIFAHNWMAKWIGSSEMEMLSVGGKKVNNKMSDPWMRKTFVLLDKPQDAIIYVASIGYHELYVNGEKIGDAVLSPSVTDHKSRARYMTYDIARYLKSGENVIALWLGTSWSIFPAYQRQDKPAIPMALVQAEITLTSGKKLQIQSDNTWKVHASPNTLLGYWEAHHFEGELYDAALEKENWNNVFFDDSDWAIAKVYHPEIEVSSDRTEPNKLIEKIKPTSICEVKPGVYRVDMGINYAGWFEMQLEGQPGDSILFQFSEREKEVCSYGIHSIYKVGPKKKGTFCNRFNYMTGRWVQISGLRKKPSLEQICGWMIRPDYRRTGGFECDIPLLNNIYRTTLWTFENLSIGNYVVDCPHRERCGYGGDALSTTRTALGNYQLGAFYNKWMEDWRDVQDADGNVPYTAPTRIGGGGPSWSGFCITLPWEIYHQYGDKRILSESFLVIQRWLGFVETKSKNDMLVRWGGKWSFLGDWLWPNVWPERSALERQGKALGDTPETLFFNNCHWIYSLETAAGIADVLNNKSVAIAYRKRASQIRKVVHSKFYNPKDHSYVNGFPSYLAIALMVDLPPKQLKSKIWKRLDQEILINHKGHIWGGITAGSFLMHTLLDNQRNDLIMEMIAKEDFPSWGYMMKYNIGTFFEDWECRGSGLHSSYLYIGSWFIEALGGIKRPEAGYGNFIIEPWIPKNGPKQVRSHYNSMYGNIVSNWTVDSGRLNLEIVIPANTTAVLKLSDVQTMSVREGDREWKNAEGVNLHSKHKNSISFTLQAGTYHFSAIMIACK